MKGFVVKDINGCYYNGIGRSDLAWENQLRKAKIYTSPKMAMNVCNQIYNLERQAKLMVVELTELGEYAVETINETKDVAELLRKEYAAMGISNRQVSVVCKRMGSQNENGFVITVILKDSQLSEKRVRSVFEKYVRQYECQILKFVYQTIRETSYYRQN